MPDILHRFTGSLLYAAHRFVVRISGAFAFEEYLDCMGLRETIDRWREEGELDSELGRLQQILESRRFTREQIEYCFETMLPGLAIMSLNDDAEEDDTLTVQRLKQRIVEEFFDEVRIIEVCGALVEVQNKPEQEILEDTLRLVDNALWQSQASGETEED